MPHSTPLLLRYAQGAIRDSSSKSLSHVCTYLCIHTRMLGLRPCLFF